ncbi:hybrid sensor histidine kinase/response regulator [Rickettsiella endosymbiont of Dermanyssus gallinae]|uniref:hybrid sensor histidine kinase/response regulator n=1 Tax=Rickettsiella endosymbiont of Dermanyssus gallinae TaxID=2856608 RepID=UPI001C52F3C7|nr:ATP-binding protein [Rickettsiella endosymbiont of Dermanyssus gallinae]
MPTEIQFLKEKDLKEYIAKIDNSIISSAEHIDSNDIIPINRFIIGCNGSLLWVNERLLKLSSIDNLSTILGKDVSIFGEMAKEGFKRVLEIKTEETVEEEYKGKHYITTRKPIFDENDQIKYVIGAAIDITKQKQAHIAKQVFLQNVAHDIRTPLAGIIGLAQLQKMGLDSLEEAKEHGEMIHDAGNQLLELLSAVVNTIDSKQMTDSVKAEPLDLSGLAKELHALMGPAVYTKGLKFPFALDPKLPLVFGDRIKLKRVLINLVSNAVKFTKEGTISLAIKLLSIENNHANLEIKVSDTGIGMAEDKLDKIFDRFYRVHPAHLEEYKGYGLGLYLVKESLDLLGGEIQVSSEEGKGTCFSLQFKFTLSNKIPDKIETVLPSISESTTKTGTVLIVEDNVIARYTHKCLLQKEGYAVSETIDGKATLEALKKGTFVWALLDIGLLELTGSEVCKEYRQWEKENNKPHLPVFVLTGHGVEEVEEECKEAGIDRVFTKPLTNKIMQDIEAFIKAS